MKDQPEVVRETALTLQVCVPAEWTDDQVKTFADAENPAGTANGWFVRKFEDHEFLPSALDERVPCSNRDGMVHVVLEC